jgi:outer membrane protein TolC
LEEQLRLGQSTDFLVADNRRAVAEREGALIAAERRYQQASIELSLYWRDPAGQPQVPQAWQAPRNLLKGGPPAPPSAATLAHDVETAWQWRPELRRLALQKQRAAVDLRLAENQLYPALNAAISGAQDVGQGKSSTGIFALDRTNVEASLMLDVPLQRREARGRILAAQATIGQLVAQERFARDQIAAEVQDAVSNLDRTYQRWLRARDEHVAAQTVTKMEHERFRKGLSNLLEVNFRELFEAGAQAKVIDALADFYRAQADHRAALAVDAVDSPEASGGQ